MPGLRLVGEAAAGDRAGNAKRPRRSNAQRQASQDAKLALRADAKVDADLSRTVDSIAFLSRNEVDPAALIARISPMEAEAVSANLEKAVDWLNRFVDGWHVFTGNIEAQGAASGTGLEAGRGGGIRLVSRRN